MNIGFGDSAICFGSRAVCVIWSVNKWNNRAFVFGSGLWRLSAREVEQHAVVFCERFQVAVFRVFRFTLGINGKFNVGVSCFLVGVFDFGNNFGFGTARDNGTDNVNQYKGDARQNSQHHNADRRSYKADNTAPECA